MDELGTLVDEPGTLVDRPLSPTLLQ